MDGFCAMLRFKAANIKPWDQMRGLQNLKLSVPRALKK
jgi:hypothetical protein